MYVDTADELKFESSALAFIHDRKILQELNGMTSYRIIIANYGVRKYGIRYLEATRTTPYIIKLGNNTLIRLSVEIRPLGLGSIYH